MGVYDIQGKNCIFQLKIGDEYLTVVCAKSFTFNPVTDMKETTTVGSGFWKEFRPRKLSYTITFNGLLQVKSLITQEKIKTLFDYQIQFLPLKYRMLYYDNSNNVMNVNGTVYVTSNLFDASPANLVNGTTELQGTGGLEIFDKIPDLANIHIVSTGDASIEGVIEFRLMDDTGAVVFDSGSLAGASGGHHTHPVNVTGQVQKGSYYFSWQVTADAIGNTFTLDAPPTKTTNFNDNTNSENTFGVQLYNFTADRNVTFAFGILTPPPSCVAPTIPGSPTLPDGQLYFTYSASFPIHGSPTFAISNVTKPSWMNINIVEVSGSYYIQFTGTPNSTGTGIVVSFNLTNACGSAAFSDTIDVGSAVIPVPINWNFTETSGSSLGLRIWVNGSLAITTDVNASGTLNVVPLDRIEVFVVGNSIAIKHLDVQELTGPTQLYNVTAGGSFLDFAWTAANGKQYQVNAGTP